MKPTKSKTPYTIRKFKDGWWSVIKFDVTNQWDQWRGPFETKAEAEIDCVNMLDRMAG